MAGGNKVAVVLFNLGGPDSLDAVKPFLFNLFNDPAIIGAPAPIRRILAWMISSRRAPVAREIYSRIGGRSPLLDLTEQQAQALQASLEGETRVFIAMRYWHPLTEQAVREVKAWGADRVILLPLYPQYSIATTGSSLRAWRQAAEQAGLTVPTTSICCYPTEEGMVTAQVALITTALDKAGPGARLLFSAHGLPKKVVEEGDPYQVQVEMTAQAVVKALRRPDLDWLISYQSRVGPMEWIGPATDAEIRRAGADGKSLVVVPIAFVSEHSETLVELDIEYGHLARDCGIPEYHRVPALGTHPAFIGALADLVRRSLIAGCNPCSQQGGRLCPSDRRNCPHSGGLV